MSKDFKFKAYGGKLKNLIVSDKKTQILLQKKALSLPRVNLNPRQLCDLELLLNGGFSPLDGFMDEKDYKSVVSKMKLANGMLWPIPIVFDVSQSENYKIGEEIVLCDEYGKPLAILSVSSIYKPDKQKEAKFVYGTSDEYHFGVNYLINEVGNYYIGGKVQGISPIERYDFNKYRITPSQLQTWFKKNKWKKIIGFQTRNPIHKAHHAMIKKAAKDYGAKVLIHPTVGVTKDGDIDYITRVRSYIKFHRKYAKNFARLSLLPLAMRMAGPREAVLHAIIRKNYGCTHFIVGRDHAGPGKDSKGIPYYAPYDAQNLALQQEKEIGIKIVPFSEMVYVENEKKYLPQEALKKGHTIKNISGTEFRKRLLNNEQIPEWFSFPEVIEELKKGAPKQKKDGLTIFFTGLPSAGKSTIATMLYFKLLEIQDKKVTFLDGDIVRQNLSKGLSFSKEDRDINITRIGFVANEITKHGGIAVCAAVAPYKAAREKNRRLIKKNGIYIEIFVSTPLATCQKRDIKGLYKKGKMGLAKAVTGIDDPYEAPENPEIKIDTSKLRPAACVNTIIKYLTSKGFMYSLPPLKSELRASTTFLK
ncbi:MAG: adenylyltransferase [Candidatus Levybacteria bacterium RIFCSPHIGHO2_01_FULL_36_15]|nr:MAG: adenylyltransferase [Candidatus Levybacteria bacterium RIFCSPHIGHO2_01_FULL_36_15]OGH38699.1 MAG: adenylyltransferase [Candidatus Levybacteria bacterium RIFCSPLOWO2_01_FULL_36_10]